MGDLSIAEGSDSIGIVGAEIVRIDDVKGRVIR
jgi:hypothetical protein